MNYFKIGSEMGFLNVNIVLLYILHNILNRFNGKKIKFSVLETQDLSIHLCFFHEYDMFYQAPNKSEGNLVYNKALLFIQIVKWAAKKITGWMKLQTYTGSHKYFDAQKNLWILLNQSNLLIYQSLM